MNEKQKKYFDLALWLAQVLLATDLILSGYTKMGTPLPVLYDMWPWTRNLWWLVGSTLLEAVAAVAIVFPAALDKNNKWTIYAAWSILAIMTVSAGFHAYHGYNGLVVEDAVCMAIAIFVIWGRTKLPTLKHKDTIKAEAEEAERVAKEEGKKRVREEKKRLKAEQKKKAKKSKRE